MVDGRRQTSLQRVNNNALTHYTLLLLRRTTASGRLLASQCAIVRRPRRVRPTRRTMARWQFLMTTRNSYSPFSALPTRRIRAHSQRWSWALL